MQTNNARAVPSTSKRKYNLCSECLTCIGRGISHKCNKETLQQNLNDLEDTAKQRMAARGRIQLVLNIVKDLLMPSFSVIKEKLAEESQGPSGTISLKQRGPALTVEVSPKKEPVKGVTASALIDWMRKKSLCLEQMRHFTQFIRKQFGRLSVEKHAQDKIVEYSHQLDDYFELVKLELIDKEGETVTRHVPVVNDATALVHHLHDKMGLDIHETFLKIGIDGGHGSLKVEYIHNSDYS